MLAVVLTADAATTAAAPAAAISRVLADPAAAARLAAVARRTAAGYAWPDLARAVLQVYRHVTGPASGGAAGS
jgi:glycosyltransferase involved in cell wall biosynthesis